MSSDRGLIALSQPYEVRYWSKKFKVTPARLRYVVRKVGHSAKKVGAYIKLQKHRARDRALISVNQAYEVRYWSKKFKVTPARLKAAVKVAGHSSKKVGAYLASSKKKKAVGASRPATAFAHCAVLVVSEPGRAVRPFSLLCARGCANMPARAATIGGRHADENPKEGVG